MEWIALSYTLPARGTSSARVNLWRRLRRLGALTMAGGTSILPARPECVEAFQWMAQEIAQAEGDAVVMRIEEFDSLTDAEVIERFRDARRTDYAELDAQADELEQEIVSREEMDGWSRHQETLSKLRRRHAEVARIDYFHGPEGIQVGARLARIADALAPGESRVASIEPVAVSTLRGRRWVTRPRPHVDRLACIWLIRRFIDQDASIRFGDEAQDDELAFDMRDATFGHQGNRCSFEAMLAALSLDDPALRAMAEIVHEIDLQDGLSQRPEVSGVDAILKGWLLADYTDAELESHGVALYEGLYRALKERTAVTPEAIVGERSHVHRAQRAGTTL
jgi:hypothetical protein